MNRAIFSSITLILLSGMYTFSYAQDDFRDAFIINSEGDTLRGTIDYRSNQKNYVSCLFRKNGSVREYGPGDILGYGFINDKVYTSALADSVFVESLFLGSMSLYRYMEGFYLAKEEEIYFLESQEITVRMNGKDYQKRDQRWRGILSALVGDCLNNTEGLLNRIDFNERSLTNVVKKYNACLGEEEGIIEFKENLPWTTIQLGYEAGIGYSMLSITDEKAQPDMPDQYTKMHPVLGLKAIFKFPRVSDRLGLITGLEFMRVTFSDRVTYNPAGQINNYDSEIRLNVLSIPTGLRYQTPYKKDFSWLFMGGFALDVQLGSDSKMVAERIGSGGTSYDPETYVFIIEDQQAGFWATAGASKRFENFEGALLLKYATMGDMTSSIWEGAYHKRFSLSILITP